MTAYTPEAEDEVPPPPPDDCDETPPPLPDDEIPPQPPDDDDDEVPPPPPPDEPSPMQPSLSTPPMARPQGLPKAASKPTCMTEGNPHGNLPLTKEGEAIDQIDFRGNTIPHQWFDHLKTDAGKTDGIGCLLLGEIVYWYRGTDLAEKNGKVVGRKRKFHSDMLQKSYQDLADKFGFTKEQIKAAIIRLEKQCLIRRDFRTITVRGMKVSNVLYIQIFPDRIREISFFPGESHPSSEKSAQGGSVENSAQVSGIVRGGVPSNPDTGVEIPADKYRDYAKDYPKEVPLPGSTTTSSLKPGKPASVRSLSQLTETAPVDCDGHDDKPGTSGYDPEAEQAQHGAIDPANLEANFNSILRRLESAFGGQSFTAHGEKKLREYVASGRINPAWAVAFERAKFIFDRDRDLYKTKNVFIPVQPAYLLSGFDLTEAGILHILGTQYQGLEAETQVPDEEDAKRWLEVMSQYDNYLRLNGCLEPTYVTWLNNFPGRRNELLDVLTNPKQLPEELRGDVVPPAWLRIHYAVLNDVYQAQDIRKALMPEAIDEISHDPGSLKLDGIALDDAQIREFFDIDYQQELGRWHERYDPVCDQMDKLQELMCAVEECSAIAALK